MKPNIIRLNENELRNIVNKAIMRILNESVREMQAYHGGKVNFDKFSADKFKTGFGACKYGNGVYLTIPKDTAGHYATSQDGQIKLPNGYVYTVEIPDYDGTNYILWDKPIGNTVFEKIKDYWYDDYAGKYIGNITPKTTGQEIYRDICDKMGVAKFHVFADYGITGVQVPDTTKEQNVINFIVFDPNDVKIIKKETAKQDSDRNYIYGELPDNN